MRLALFVTCLGDTLFPSTGRAVVRLLERLGHEVEFPEEQTCCGQPMANVGCLDHARPLAERFLRTFGRYDSIVAPTGSCVAMVRHHYEQVLGPSAELDEVADPRGLRFAAAPGDAQPVQEHIHPERLGHQSMTCTYTSLRSSAGKMRSGLTRSLSMRQIPRLKFHIDEGLTKKCRHLGQRQACDKSGKRTNQAHRTRVGIGWRAAIEMPSDRSP
jgi:hypothetical protein